MKRSMGGEAREIYRMEQLAQGQTFLHRLHPMVKLLGTLCNLVCLMSLDPMELGQLAPFVLYPVVLMAAGEIPWGMLWKRTAVALPFCLFAGMSNLLFDREVLAQVGRIPVTGGMVSCLSILLRTLLCVSAVLVLVSLTPFSQITGQLRRAHFPDLLVRLFEMTYRYVGTLLEEAGSMSTAYHLRAGRRRGLEMRHMGSFVGQLLIRSYDRAERVYHAMECRGYGAPPGRRDRRPLTGQDVGYLLVCCGGTIFFRLVNVPEILGRWMLCWM